MSVGLIEASNCNVALNVKQCCERNSTVAPVNKQRYSIIAFTETAFNQCRLFDCSSCFTASRLTFKNTPANSFNLVAKWKSTSSHSAPSKPQLHESRCPLLNSNAAQKSLNEFSSWDRGCNAIQSLAISTIVLGAIYERFYNGWEISTFRD